MPDEPFVPTSPRGGLDPTDVVDAAAALILDAARDFQCQEIHDDTPRDDTYFENQARAQALRLLGAGWMPPTTTAPVVVDLVAEILNRMLVSLDPQQLAAIRDGADHITLGEDERRYIASGALAAVRWAQQQPRALMAPKISASSWLQRDEYSNFRAAYGYAAGKMRAIEPLSKLDPEEVYWLWVILQHGFEYYDRNDTEPTPGVEPGVDLPASTWDEYGVHITATALGDLCGEFADFLALMAHQYAEGLPGVDVTVTAGVMHQVRDGEPSTPPGNAF